MMWRPVLNARPSAVRFEQRMKVKMNIEGIIIVLLKSKIIYSFELICSHGLVPGITSLSMCLLNRPESHFLAELAKFLGFLRKYVLVFYQFRI